MPSVSQSLRPSLKTESWTGLLGAVAFFIFGNLPAELPLMTARTLVAASLVPVPFGAYFALGKSSRRASEALTHRGVRFTFSLSFSLSLLWLTLAGSPGVRLGVVSFLLGIATGDWYLYSVADIEYGGDEGSVFPS
ncbi:hypothetical protein GL213_03210 [Halogeometricum borinquense]|uniref:Uncharacterized protein n=1 Tax=Halogeometricum borinquense TaxID=60847 RepID=A0A6C0UJW2_9EURY|nr:hypothetical protein [Halogeometricum borinquense]QIB75792.1 hypothetical protein G3I44_16815 [Halogeometricum borinquense]QIQ75627.1 hypothetical protein GL213_03210 [Halogeometricum borinquense]